MADLTELAERISTDLDADYPREQGQWHVQSEGRKLIITLANNGPMDVATVETIVDRYLKDNYIRTENLDATDSPEGVPKNHRIVLELN